MLVVLLLPALLGALGVVAAIGRVYAEKHAANAAAQGAARAAVTYWLNEAQRRSLDREAQYGACSAYQSTDSLRDRREETREQKRRVKRTVTEFTPQGPRQREEEVEETYTERRPVCIDRRDDRAGGSGLSRSQCWQLRGMQQGGTGGYWLLLDDYRQLLGDGPGDGVGAAARVARAFLVRGGYDGADGMPRPRLAATGDSEVVLFEVKATRQLSITIPFWARPNLSVPVTSAKSVDAVEVPSRAESRLSQSAPQAVPDVRDQRICPVDPYRHAEPSFYRGDWREG